MSFLLNLDVSNPVLGLKYIDEFKLLLMYYSIY